MTTGDLSTITCHWPEADIAVLRWDTPGKGANVLSSRVLEEFRTHLDALEARRDLAGVILVSGKPGQFLAGADLREFAALIEAESEAKLAACERGQQLFARLSAGDFLSVAAISGVCLGGGAELASWCDRRLFTDHPRTEFGFPEVRLGLIPGWGGTVRAPRLVGLSHAIEMITSGRSLSAQEACAMGWASDVVPEERLVEAAVRRVRAERRSGQYLADRAVWDGPISCDATEMAFLGATAAAVVQQQTQGHYPAPQMAVQLMLETAGLDASAALRREAEAMAQLFGSATNRALLNVFFLNDRNKKDRGTSVPIEVLPRLQRVGVVGAGIMGRGIAAANVKQSLHVTLTDANPAALEPGVRAVLDEAAYDKAAKSATRERVLQLAPYLRSASDLPALADCDLLIEAIVEDLAAKQTLLRTVEGLLRPEAILATNTSTLPVDRLAEGLARPEKFCGIHFFNPVRQMKLVEVIRGSRTDDETVAAAVAYGKLLGKAPIVVKDGPGFLVNRVLMPYMHEAVALLQEGHSLASVDRAARKFGLPMGPFELFDMVGLDTALFAGKVLAEAFADRHSEVPLLSDMVQAGRLGCKSGRGFYCYENRQRKAQPDDALTPLLQPHLRSPSSGAGDMAGLTDRLILPMLNEACRVLEDGLVRHARDVDLALILGIGFPPFRGGLLYWADTEGPAAMVERLQRWSGLGARYEPSRLLCEVAGSSGSLYAG